MAQGIGKPVPDSGNLRPTALMNSKAIEKGVVKNKVAFEADVGKLASTQSEPFFFQSSVETMGSVVIDDDNFDGKGPARKNRQSMLNTNQDLGMMRPQKGRATIIGAIWGSSATVRGGQRVIPMRTYQLKEVMLGTSAGHYFLLLILASALVCGGAAAWMAAGGTADYEDEWSQAIWLSWGVFFDPGTQTGLSATEKVGPQVVAVIFSILGFVFNLTVLGTVVEGARRLLEDMVTLF